MNQSRRDGSDIIRKIELTPLFVPFHEMVRELLRGSEGGLGMAIPAEEAWNGGDFVICKLSTNDGTAGFGEAFVWLPETGVSPSQIVSSIADGLKQYVIGETPFNIERINHRMDINVTRNEVPKGLIDMACYDLMGQLTGRSAMDFMGGQVVEEVPLAALIPSWTPKRWSLFAR